LRLAVFLERLLLLLLLLLDYWANVLERGGMLVRQGKTTEPRMLTASTVAGAGKGRDVRQDAVAVLRARSYGLRAKQNKCGSNLELTAK
jgi:hypothetical protein